MCFLAESSVYALGRAATHARPLPPRWHGLCSKGALECHVEHSSGTAGHHELPQPALDPTHRGSADAPLGTGHVQESRAGRCGEGGNPGSHGRVCGPQVVFWALPPQHAASGRRTC